MSFDDLTASFNSSYGKVGSKGYAMNDVERIPTGIFQFDLMTGGGIPRGRVTEFYGAESSNKTNLALKAIAMHQALWPEKKCAFFDIEHSFDPTWAERLGVDVESLYVFEPDFTEQCINMIEGLLNDPECGLVVLDSLAAMVTIRESDQDAEKDDVGGSGKASKKLFNKILLSLRRAERAGNKPTFLYINQIRHKIGVMYGSPETTPGGFTPKFACAMRVKFYAKDVMDKPVSAAVAARKEVHNVVMKHKVPIVAREAVFELAMIPHPGKKGLQPGEAKYWNTLWTFLQNYGMGGKVDKPKGYHLLGEIFPTLTALQEHVEADVVLSNQLRQDVIAKAREELFKSDKFAAEAEYHDPEDNAAAA